MSESIDQKGYSQERGPVLSVAEEALRDSELRYRTTLDSIADAIHIIDWDMHIVFMNKTFQAWLASLGLDANVMRKSVFEVFPFLPERVREEYKRVFERGETVITEESVTIAGCEIFTETRKIPLWERGRIAEVLTIVRDITQHKARENALRESEEKYRNILGNIQEGYYEVDLAGNFTFFNSAMCRILGYTPEELQGLSYKAYYRPEDYEKVFATFSNVFETGKVETLTDWEVLRKDGTIGFLGISIGLIRGADNLPTGFRGIARDVSERIKGAQALLESEERYRELFENANDIFYTHDLEGRFTSLNKAGERISGYGRDEVANLHIEDILVEEHRELAAQMVKRKLAHDDPTRYELAFLAKDGHVVPVEVSTRVIYEDGRPVGIQGIARDISERKRNEEERLRFEAQLQHAQKLEGLGVLAGGIAHDFNNLLVGMLGYASLAMLKLPQDSPARAYVEQIEITAKRAAELTNQMLAYSGRGAFTIRPIQLNKLAEELGRLLGASIGKKITLEYSYSPGLPIIQGDPAQLQQVIMNLITNASDAIGDEAGVIRVSTTAVRADRAYLSETYLDEDLAEGVYVCLEVSDTGGGMDRETQAKIFDPFFSTKFAGRGLGLAAVLGIVRGHRGAIKVYSEKGHGATFKILFPAAAFTEETITTAESIIRADRELEAWSASGAILIADDEENARNVAQAALEMHGLKTLAAKDGREALELFQQHRSDIRAVLLDLMMPVMDGEEAFRHITALSPETPIIMSSGYTEQDVVERFTENKPTAFIQKPYTVKELVRKVRRVIEA